MNFEKDHEVNKKDVKKETRVKKMLGLFERFPTDPKEEMMKEGNKRNRKVLEERWSKGIETEKDIGVFEGFVQGGLNIFIPPNDS